MRTTRFLYALPLLIAGTVTAFVASCEPVPAATATLTQIGTSSDVLADVRRAWIAAYNAGDADAVAAYFAEDAVMAPPNEALVRGKAAITAYLRRDLDGWSGTLSIVSGEVRTSGPLAVDWAVYAVTDSETPDAPGRTGKFVMVFQKDAAGAWKIVSDIWNGNGPEPSAGP